MLAALDGIGNRHHDVGQQAGQALSLEIALIAPGTARPGRAPAGGAQRRRAGAGNRRRRAQPRREPGHPGAQRLPSGSRIPRLGVHGREVTPEP